MTDNLHQPETTTQAEAYKVLTATIEGLKNYLDVMAKLKLGEEPVSLDNPIPVTQGQIEDDGNSVTIDSTTIVPWTGEWFLTREAGIVRQLTVLASNVSIGLGGTFTFQYSRDGINPTINEVRPIEDFSTLRDFSLENAGRYYRILFNPSRALTPGEFIFIDTFHSRQYEGPFVRLLNQELEEENAALQHLASFIKCLRPDGKSINVRSTYRGALQTSIIDHQIGEPVTITPSGSLKTADLIRLIGGQFNNNAILPTFWTTLVANGGTNVVGGGELTLSTNTTANGSAKIQSFKKGRFISDNVNVIQCDARLGDISAVNNVRRWGAFDPNNTIDGNGHFFEFNGSDIRIVTRKGGVDSVIPSASFNGDTPFILDTAAHNYEVFYSSTYAYFFQDRKIIHSAMFPMFSPFLTFDLRLGFENTNTGGSTTQRQLFTRGSSLARLGPATGRPNFANVSAAGTVTLKNNAGNFRRVAVSDPGVAGASISFYDSLTASGTLIATIDLTVASVASLEFDLDFDTGLTYIVTGAGFNLTVVFD